MKSRADSIASLAPEKRKTFFEQLSDEELEVLLYDWGFWGREDQQSPNWNWFLWIIQAGRGWGKTRTGAQKVNDWAEVPGSIIHIVARTTAEYRDVIVKGPAGIINNAPPWFRPKWTANERRLQWPNGSYALCFSSEEPDQLRGPQCHKAYADELAAWRYEETLSNLLLGLRLGEDPQMVVTTTPRPSKVFKELLETAKSFETHMTRGALFDNAANLAAPFVEGMRKRYDGTRLGRQELYGELLDDNPRALWQRAWFEQNRIRQVRFDDPIERVAVGVDPNVSEKDDDSVAETGIIVAGRTTKGNGIVLDDLSLRGTPRDWASAAITGYHKHRANKIIAEGNQGGAMVKHTIHSIDPSIPVEIVHASHSKQARAEPVSALYEQGRVSHLGTFAQLEDQCCEYEPIPQAISPDRLDALVWVLTHLLVKRGARMGGIDYD